MLGLQLVLFCLLYIGMVKIAVKDSGLNCLYFYPDAFLDEAEKRGIADKEATKKKGKRFMIPFCLILLAALLLILCVWNRVTDFKTAYLQSVLFLVVSNWFDGIVIDELWVGRSKIWKIKGMEDVPLQKAGVLYAQAADAGHRGLSGHCGVRGWACGAHRFGAVK